MATNRLAVRKSCFQLPPSSVFDAFASARDGRECEVREQTGDHLSMPIR